MLKRDADIYPNKISWVTLVRDLLSSLGIYEVWLAQGVDNTEFFMYIFKQRLHDNNLQLWHNRLENSTRAIFFREIIDFDFQWFFKCLDVQKFRIAFTRLIVSSHNLKVEFGRWHKPRSIPLADRKCTICDKLEDEFHFILECSLYYDLRKQYIKKYYWCRPSMFKLKQLFESKNEIILKHLSMYVFKSFEIRKSVDNV